LGKGAEWAGFRILAAFVNAVKAPRRKRLAEELRLRTEHRKSELLRVIEKYGTELQRERVKHGYGDLEHEACSAIEPVIYAPLLEAGLKTIEGIGEDLNPTEVGDREFELISTVGKLIPDADVKAVNPVSGEGPAVRVAVSREGVLVSKSFRRAQKLSTLESNKEKGWEPPGRICDGGTW